MLDDWSAKGPPDLMYFVPYTWKLRLQLKHYELLTPTNEYNWIDTSSTAQENAHMGLCGEVLNLAFDLPYTEFLPNIVPFNFDISVRTEEDLFLPPQTFLS